MNIIYTICILLIALIIAVAITLTTKSKLLKEMVKITIMQSGLILGGAVGPELTDSFFQVSILNPRRLAKGCSSTITVQIYTPFRREEVLLFSPAINFSDEVLKELDGQQINRVTFTAIPNEECLPRTQEAVLSIRDSETNIEYESIPFSFVVDDFAFDHVSKPVLSYVSSGITGMGSLALFTLSFLQKVDATLGIPVGTVGTALAIFLGSRSTFLYKNEVKNG